MNVIAIAQPVRSRAALPYLFAVSAAAVAIVIYTLFAQTLQAYPFLLPVTAVTLVAFFGGSGPAVLTALLSEVVIQLYIVRPGHSFAVEWPVGYIGLLFYATLCGIIIFLMHGMFAANAALQTTEASLQKLNDDLERRVGERTASLVQARNALRQANQNLESTVETRVRELKVANEEIQRFAYIVSHDLRAPLVNVLGFTSELAVIQGDLSLFMRDVAERAPDLVTGDLRMALETDLPEALGFIRSSTSKMDRLISAILKLSREGRRQLTPEPIDLAALVGMQAASLSQQLSARHAEIAVVGTLPLLVSDRLAVEQIFGNLIENAVKYLSRGRPGRILVSGRQEEADLVYDIADNGRGVEVKDYERIFDLFRRAGEQDTPGEGIGLATVRNLARRLGGNVTVRSEPGVGSTFSVILPAVFRRPAVEQLRD